MIPEAADMARAIRVVTTKLLQNNVLDAESYPAIDRLIGKLQGQGHQRTWSYNVERSTGIRFSRQRDDHGDVYTAVVSVDGIDVADEGHHLPPIRKLDISLELRYEHSIDRTVRWHVDQANRDSNTNVCQPGPRFHLQYGGHVHVDRSNDVRLNLPRWSHPPMDLVLLLELVTANFFPGKWMEIREDIEWCRQIQLCQKLYFHHYQCKLKDCLDVSHGTFLSLVWADSWWN